MKTKRFWSLRLAVVPVLLLLGAALFVSSASAGGSHKETKFRWDIISVDFSTGTLSAGGHASAKANDGSMITLTGNGTFNAASNFGNRDVTGGGTWQTDNPTASGTYKVTSFVSFTVAPGTPPLPHDNIGNLKDNRAGLLFVTIQFSNGSTGVLTVSCHLVGTPNSVFEGIRVSMGFVDYWNWQPGA